MNTINSDDVRTLIKEFMKEHEITRKAEAKSLVTEALAEDEFWYNQFKREGMKSRFRWAVFFSCVALVSATLGITGAIGFFTLYLPYKNMERSTDAAIARAKDAATEATSAKVAAEKSRDEANALLREVSTLKLALSNKDLKGEFESTYSAFSKLDKDARKDFVDGVALKAQLDQVVEDQATTKDALKTMQRDISFLGRVAYHVGDNFSRGPNLSQLQKDTFTRMFNGGDAIGERWTGYTKYLELQ